ncbi:MAG TPA: hypothetical protein VGQ46_17040 [Thermoanaerobaculia bacterium]|nr:hypothetical protein [Thermoanaerobaculia bacterium]
MDTESHSCILGTPAPRLLPKDERRIVGKGFFSSFEIKETDVIPMSEFEHRSSKIGAIKLQSIEDFVFSLGNERKPQRGRALALLGSQKRFD